MSTSSQLSGEKIRVDVGGMPIEWDVDNGQCTWAGVPSVSMFVPSSVLGLMSGFQRMAGTERFNLAVESGGRRSIEDDWTFLSGYPTFEEGFRALGIGAATAGWGRWQAVSVDRERKEARFRVVNGWEALYQKELDVCWGSSMMAGKLAGFCTRLFGQECEVEQTSFAARGDLHDEFTVRCATITLEERLQRLLDEELATKADLAIALHELKREVEERVRIAEELQQTEQELREKLSLIERQQHELRALATPILQVWDGVLTLPLIGTLDGVRAGVITEELLDAIVRTGARYAILDMTGVDGIDEATADHVIRIVRAVGLLGAKGVITGVRPAVAALITSLGLDMSAVATQRNLREGLRMCIRSLGGATAGGGGGR
ncbi:STAS domain-containing protein [Sorangium sp. So ce1014]|uniref:STAS domain-containing protein n=1 Tax=Sorangium sp. So ce1014 TaxID=3133326 RepID=UPI003F6037D8